MSVYTCNKCPRTFRLEEFFAKHQKVHELKRQHRCGVCGFVYGAAKGLEGHVKTAHTQQEIENGANGYAYGQPNGLAHYQQDMANEANMARVANVANGYDYGPSNVGHLKTAQTQQDMAKTASVACVANGFVYGAAKGLEGHTKTAHTQQEIENVANSYAYGPPNGLVGQLKNAHYQQDMANMANMARVANVAYMANGYVYGAANGLEGYVKTAHTQQEVENVANGYAYGPANGLLGHLKAAHTQQDMASVACMANGYAYVPSNGFVGHLKISHSQQETANVTTVGNGLVYEVQNGLHGDVKTAHTPQQIDNVSNDVNSNFCSRRGVLKKDVNMEEVHEDKKVAVSEAGSTGTSNQPMYKSRKSNKSKCVWCPACGDGFIRGYLLKVHIYKVHGEEYVKNNFTPEEFAALIKPPRGTRLEEKKIVSPLTCHVCNEMFHFTEDFYFHMENVHELPIKKPKGKKGSGINPMEPRPSQKNRVYSDTELEPLVNEPALRRSDRASKTNAPLKNGWLLSIDDTIVQPSTKMSKICQASKLDPDPAAKRAKLNPPEVTEPVEVLDEADDLDFEEGCLIIDEDEDKENCPSSENEVPAVDQTTDDEDGDFGQDDIYPILSCSPPSNDVYNAEDIQIDSEPVIYPLFLKDFSLPFSLSYLVSDKYDNLPPETLHELEKMRDEMKKIKVKRKPKSKKVISPPQTKGNKKPSPRKARNNIGGGSPKIVEGDNVTDYDNQIQNNCWPLDCTKCKTRLVDLENFNRHMNDHWSENKSCAVCGLVIYSKRSNFRQHLMIHTGQKPFECFICNKGFRQKVHLVKHVATHRDLSDDATSETVN